MPTIIISTPGSILATDSSCFTLRHNKKLVTRLPINVIDRFIILPDVEVTRKALERIGSFGIPATFINRSGQIMAHLSPPWKYAAAPRLEQARCWHDATIRLSLAQRFIQAKLINSAQQLHRYASNHPGTSHPETASQLKQLAEMTSTTQDNDSLMGLEGYGSRLYFQALGTMFHCGWTSFNGRNRRPPRDPINATLSFVYTFLCNHILAYLQGHGLDPAISYLHSINDNRPNLSLDLIEPLRSALGDRLVLRLFNLGQLKAEHFEAPQPSGAIYLNKEGRQLVLTQFEPWISSCNDDLTPQEGSRRPTSPQRIIQVEIERFHQFAKAGNLHEFLPCGLEP